MQHTRLPVLASFLTLLLFGGCSDIGLPSPTQSDETLTTVRLAVLSTTEKYLTAIVQGNEPVLDRVVLWGEYNSDLSDIKRSRQSIFNRIKKLKPGWSAESTPFKNFKVEDVDIDGDQAEVNLSRGSQDLEVELQWTGRSWLVVGDSIFGESGYLSSTSGNL